jgi:superfamily II DNA/RNA helicase
LVRHRFSAGALHGDMTQPVRFATLERFKAGEIRLLVCSDVAARGLDIGGLSHVFNFDVPHHAEDYVHRVGRTGRAEREGRAFTLATPEDRLAVEAIEKLIGLPIPRIAIEGLDPVAWAEGDGRRRRGRAPARRTGSTAARPPRTVKPETSPRPERAPVERPAPPERVVRTERAVRAERAPGRARSPVEAAAADHVRGFGEQVPAFMLVAPRRKPVRAAPRVAELEP